MDEKTKKEDLKKVVEIKERALNYFVEEKRLKIKQRIKNKIASLNKSFTEKTFEELENLCFEMYKQGMLDSFAVSEFSITSARQNFNKL